MNVLVEHRDLYLGGLRTTVSLTLVAFMVALVLGTLTAAFRVSPIPPLRGAAATVVELVRNTPLTLLMLLFYFGFTKAGVGPYTEFASAAIVLSAYTAAFVSEAVRSGINAVAKGQADAARAIGLTFPQILGLVVLPQAFRTVVAPIGNLFIAHTKNSSIASVISVHDLAFNANSVYERIGDPIPAYLGVAVAYLVLTFPSGFLFGAIERRVAIKR